MQVHHVAGLVVRFRDPLRYDAVPGKRVFRIEKRADEAEKLVGYAAVFGAETDIGGYFREVVQRAPRSPTVEDRMPPPRALSAYRLDRTGEGSLRAVYTWVYNALIKGLFGVKVRDINFEFKLCRSRIFDDIQLQSEGSFIDAELVIRSTRMGYEIMQMGVDYFPRTRGESTLSSPGVIVTIIKEMWSLRSDLHSIEKVR